MEGIRWFAIREIGKNQGTARFSGRHLHNLQSEVDAVKGRVDTTVVANLVVSKFDKLRGDTRVELLKLQAELDTAGT